MPKITLGTANFNNYYGVTKNKFASSEINKDLQLFLERTKLIILIQL